MVYTERADMAAVSLAPAMPALKYTTSVDITKKKKKKKKIHTQKKNAL